MGLVEIEPAYHRGCSGRVLVRRYPAGWGYWGGWPAEVNISCDKCGDIGADEVSESPQELCEGCGKVLTDCGEMCGGCQRQEVDEEHADRERPATSGVGAQSTFEK